MLRPYLLRFDKPIIKLTRGLPVWNRYSFASADQRSFKTFDGAEVSSQRLHMTPFHIELFEVRVDTNFRIRYEVLEKQYFLFFMLEGSINFKTHEDFYTSYVKNGHYAFVLNASGKYFIELPKGSYTVLLISISPDWLSFFSKDQPLLRNFISSKVAKYAWLPCCRIDRETAYWLRALYADFTKGVGVLDGKLRFYISFILEQYGSCAEKKEKILPYLLKQYLEDHYHEPDLSLSRLADHFQFNERTIRNQFKSEFNTTLHHYYTCLRLSRTLDLMNLQNVPLSKIYYQVGYNDESTLRYEMRKFGLL